MSQLGINLQNCWNWKAASLSAGARGLIFLVMTANHGWRSMTLAFVAETAFRAASAGFCAAFVQSIRHMKPRWIVAVIALALLPTATLGLEYAIHSNMGTPNLAASMVVSFVVSCITSLFDLYALRRGILLTGEAGQTLTEDLKQIPQLALSFVAEPMMWIWRSTRDLLAGEAEY
jgi:hypothetical protein